MAQIRIDQLDVAAFATTSDIYAIVQGGQTLQLTSGKQLDLVATMFQPGGGITWTYNSLLKTITPSLTVTVDADEVGTLVIGTPAYDNVQAHLNIFTSAGLISGGVITNAGGGNINIALGAGVIRAANDPLVDLRVFDFPAVAGILIPDGTTRFVGVEYNAGTPQVVVKTTETWDYNTDFPLGSVTREGLNLFIANRPWRTADPASRLLKRLDGTDYVERDSFTGGLLLEASGTRNIKISAGKLRSRVDEFTVAAKDTSIADTFSLYYRDGLGGFTLVAAQTQWDNLNYDNGTGVLAALTVGFYTDMWVYVSVNGNLLCMYGNNQYATLGEAMADAALPLVPDHIRYNAVLAGRVIFQQAAVAPAAVQSSFGAVFSGNTVSDHGALAGLADDDHLQYHTDARARTWIRGVTGTYTSPNQVITAAGALVLPHGLGVIPTICGVYLVNTVAEQGYAIGQIASPELVGQDADRGVNISRDATNLTIRYGSSSSTFRVKNATTGATVSATNANWQAVFWARI